MQRGIVSEWKHLLEAYEGRENDQVPFFDGDIYAQTVRKVADRNRLVSLSLMLASFTNERDFAEREDSNIRRHDTCFLVFLLFFGRCRLCQRPRRQPQQSAKIERET